MTDDTHVDRTSVAVFGGRLAKGLAVWLAPDREVRLVSDDSAVVATERDRAGLLVAQTLAVGDGVDRVLVRFDDPDYEPVFSGLDRDGPGLGSVPYDAVESTLEPTAA
jgi:Trk K+ transport system NAD-binding subunit